jgi:hypothetical protein
MAQTETRPGFRLPWTSESTDADQEAWATAPEAPVSDAATPAEDAVTPQTDAPASDPAATAATGGTRRQTKFMAELSAAMQAAAEHARDETLTRLTADLKTVTEEIQSASTGDAADLRRRADDDVAAVREWSKAEIAKIREETEERIVARKASLDGEMDAHAAVVAARVEQVAVTVTEFETRMAAFFERLRAEEDPTRIATMAETMPDPPDLVGVAAAIAEPVAEPFDPAGPAKGTESTREMIGMELAGEGVSAVQRASDFAAAEAEAAAFTGDLDDETEGVTSQAEAEAIAEIDPARLAGTMSPSPNVPERATTRVVVVGLVSVASIATFKRSLGRIPGVSAIGVASGPDGEFVFTVSHGADVALGELIGDLPGFQAQVTDEAADGLHVTAQDPDNGA